MTTLITQPATALSPFHIDEEMFDSNGDDASTGTVEKYPDIASTVGTDRGRFGNLGAVEAENNGGRESYTSSRKENIILASRSSSDCSQIGLWPEDTHLWETGRGSLDGVTSINPQIEDSIRLAKRRMTRLSGNIELSTTDSVERKNPLQRWIRTLHQRNINRQAYAMSSEERNCSNALDHSLSMNRSTENSISGKGHRKSSSWASSGFVTAVKSATASLTSMSIAPTSRRQSLNLASTNDRSARRSWSHERSIDEAHNNEPGAVDEATLERSYKRGSIIEEIVRTEESYVADLRLLVDVYRNMNFRVSTVIVSPILRNINEILNIHEVLLASIRPIITLSATYRDSRTPLPKRTSVIEHGFEHQVIETQNLNDEAVRVRPRTSLDIRRKRAKQDERSFSDPGDAARLAHALNNIIDRLFVYEEYGSRFSSMFRQLALTERFHDMGSYEKGLEALAHTIAPCSARNVNRRKGLTYKDLLMKPIQRITKYPLLFSDLLSQTPVVDCPVSCNEVEKTLYRLRETVDEINKATNDEHAHKKIQRSWRLQDMLRFPELTSPPFAIRSLGHAKLCGLLYVTYQTGERVCGNYMLCSLFRSCLLLATRSESSDKVTCFEIFASISLANLESQSCDNGHGLQCFNALYSWKIVFEAEQHLFEVILCACSAREEAQWRTLVKYYADKETRALYDDGPRAPNQYSWLASKTSLRPLAEAFGQPGTLARRLSKKRPATISPRSDWTQVVIRNTHSLKQNDKLNAECTLVRSQTVQPGPRVQILAPRRLNRIRMEQELAHVWTKELLPFPGMSCRSERVRRASASSMMRRLSRATSNSFSKRVASLGAPNSIRHEEPIVQIGEDGHTEPERGAGSDVLNEFSQTFDGADMPMLGRLDAFTSGEQGEAADQKPDLQASRIAMDTERLGCARIKQKIGSSFTLIRTMSLEGMKTMFGRKE